MKNIIIPTTICIIMVFMSCSKNKFDKEENLRNFLNHIRVGDRNTIILMLFNDFCNPCIEETVQLMAQINDLSTDKDRVLIYATGGNFINTNYNNFAKHPTHRHIIESFGLKANLNYLFVYDHNSTLTNFWILDLTTISKVYNELYLK